MRPLQSRAPDLGVSHALRAPDIRDAGSSGAPRGRPQTSEGHDMSTEDQSLRQFAIKATPEDIERFALQARVYRAQVMKRMTLNAVAWAANALRAPFAKRPVARPAA